MKLNPSPITTPEGSRPVSQGPDMYQMMPHMTDVKCAAGCANFNEKLLVCGELKLNTTHNEVQRQKCFGF